MSILDTMMRMQYANQQEVPNAINQLGDTLGGIMAQRGQRDFQQDAIKWFSDGEVTPDKIKQFSAMYPQVDPQEVFKIAGAAAQQKKAQKVKDMGATIMRIASENNGELPPEAFKEIAKGVDGSLLPEVMTAFTAFKKVHPEVKWEKLNPGDESYQTIAGKPTGVKITGPAKPEDKDTLVMKKDGSGVTRTTKTVAAQLMESAGYVPYQALSQKEDVETWGEPYEDSIGGKKAKVQKSSRGQVRPVIQDASTIYLEGRNDRSDRQFGANLRKEFNALPEIKEANLIMPKIKSMESAFEESKTTKNFVAVDQALITLFNKLTDPSSVVRESEYARTAMNIPLINQIKGKVGKVMEGGAGLTSEERASLMKMAKLMQSGYMDIKGKRVTEYRGYAKQAGINGDDIIGDYGTSAPTPKKVGRFTIEVE
jgi:hypothetical protein